jgi:hypothetical protein
MAVIRVDCNYDPMEYRGVTIRYRNLLSLETFNTGNFIIDWYEAIKFFNGDLAVAEEFLSYSSSVDEYVSESKEYMSAYLHVIDGEFVLKYLDRSLPNWWEDESGVAEGIELFVPMDKELTWYEYHTLCNI